MTPRHIPMVYTLPGHNWASVDTSLSAVRNWATSKVMAHARRVGCRVLDIHGWDFDTVDEDGAPAVALVAVLAPLPTIATACPCPVFLRWDAAAHPEPEPDGPCLVCEEVGYQLLCGEMLEQVAPRILNRHGRPYRLDSLVAHLRRHGRADLVPPGSQRRVTA